MELGLKVELLGVASTGLLGIVFDEVGDTIWVPGVCEVPSLRPRETDVSATACKKIVVHTRTMKVDAFMLMLHRREADLPLKRDGG